jgi:hypothetical protein
MGIHWKSKQTQKNLLGKSTLAHQSSNLSPVLQAISPVCPSGEQIVNGGFETGDFTGWTETIDVEVVKSGNGMYLPHAGSYSVGTLALIGSMKQTLITPVPVECVKNTFSLWIISGYGVSPTGGGKFRVEINYTDETNTTVIREITEGEKDTWIEWDLKNELASGKTIESIKITLDGGHSGTIPYVDDVSLIP